MNNRVPKPAPAQRAPFGLIAWLEKTRIVLPLKGVECAFHVCGDVVSVEIDQIFEQNNSRPLDCIYTFPLPAGAAVYRCEMHVNGRMIRARVEERERARALVEEKKAAGFRTTLVEMERDNLFTLSLGNVQPGDVIVIRFAYFQILTRLGDWTSFNIPFCPGIRYIPGTPLLRSNKGRGIVDDTDQVPDASRISPPRMDQFHRDAAYLSVEGTVEHPLDDIKDISSPSHPVVLRFDKGLTKVAIADQAAVPDCDFVLRWTELQPTEVKPAGWLTHSNGENVALLRLRAPTQVAAADNYAQDVYFLIDRSGSMRGLKWQKAAEAFRAFLNALGAQDRVWATFFESQFRDLAEKPLPVQALRSDATVQNLESLGAAGGTELLPALEHVLAKIAEHSSDRPASLVLITDGQVGNESTVLQRLARQSQLRVNVFGIDVAINDGFLKKLAAQHNGASCLLTPQDDIVGAVARLGSRLRRPVLTSIRVPSGWELPGTALPDLFEGEVLSLPLRSTASVDLSKSISISGNLPDGTTTTCTFDLLPTNAPAIPLLWARRRIDSLLAQNQTDAAIALAKQVNLVCVGAAFVAWDETEKVPVSAPDAEIYQPALLTKHLAGRMAFAAGAFSALKASASESIAGTQQLSDAAGLEGPTDILFSRGSALSFDNLSPDELRAAAERFASSIERDPFFQRDLARDPLFQTPTGRRLVDTLCAWARSNTKKAPARSKAIADFTVLLNQNSNRPVSERLAILGKWIEAQIEGPFRKYALEDFRALETEIQKPMTTPSA